MIQRFCSTAEYIPRKEYPVDYIKQEYKNKEHCFWMFFLIGSG